MKSYIIYILLFFSSLGLANNQVVICDFQEYIEGKFPDKWGIKKGFWYTSGSGNKTWVIKSEDKNKYISASSNNDSYTIGKKYSYNLEKYKILKWKWRIHKLPVGGDERTKEKGDSAAGVYVVFPGIAIPHSIKYVWSSTLDVGTITDSPFTSRTKIIVIRTGLKNTGEWVEEKRNVYEDFLKVFGISPKNPQGIALLTDSDNTGTSAKADYNDIIAVSE